MGSLKWLFEFSSLFLSYSLDPLVYPESPAPEFCGDSSTGKTRGLLWARIITSTSKLLSPEEWQKEAFL